MCLDILDVVMVCLLGLPFSLILFDTFFRVIFVGVAGFSRTQDRPGPESASFNQASLLLLVMAHNEGRIIDRTLTLMKAEIAADASVTLALLADHCSDDTVILAEQCGVKIFVRSEGESGKSQALSWLATNCEDELEAYELVAILDADTMIPADFCKNARAAFLLKDTYVVQSFVEPVNALALPIATLAAFSEILAQRIDDEARFRLGWTSPLRGTGMIFRRDIFLHICPGLQTQVDDIELSLRLAELKLPVVHFTLLKIFDPKSTNMLGLARQRGRWLMGQRAVWRGWHRKLNIPSRLSEWSLLHALLLKPKIALLAMKVALLGIFYYIDTSVFYFPCAMVTFSLCVDFVYYVAGLRHVSEPRKYLLSFLSAPFFFAMWMTGWIFSFRTSSEWLRARE